MAARLPSAMRLALALSALFTACAIAAGAIAYGVMSDELRARLFEDTRVSAVALGAELSSHGTEALATQVRTLSAIGKARSELYYFLPAGSDSPVGDLQIPAPFDGPRVLVAGRDMTFSGLPGEQQGETFYAYGLSAPGGRIVVARDSQWITDSQEVLTQSVAWGLGVALVGTVMLAFVMGRRSTRRVARLNELLASVAAGNLAARYPEGTEMHDDVGEVARGINAMLERLEANVEHLAQVSADIAHDLRSPLTRLRLRLEPHVLRDDLPGDARAAIAASLESLDGISATFDAILQISQMQTGAMTVEMAPVDLATFCRDIEEMMAPVAEEHGHHLSRKLPNDALVVDANAELLTQALVNLVENAVRYAPFPAAIEIAVERRDGEVMLTVSDDGPGIPAEDRERVTMRFVRLDRSRHRPGTGLGLSLVSAIARLHHGRLELGDNAPGLRASIIVPIRSGRSD